MDLHSVTYDQVIEMVEHLPQDVLPDVVAYLEKISPKAAKRQNWKAVSGKEAEFLKIIQRKLSPNEQARLSELREKSEWDELTEAETAELFAYVEQVEREDAERAEAILHLAQLRNVPVAQILQQFPV